MRKLIFIIVALLAQPVLAEEFPLTETNRFQEAIIELYSMDLKQQKARVESGELTEDQLSADVRGFLRELSICSTYRLYQYQYMKNNAPEREDVIKNLSGLYNMDVGHFMYIAVALESVFGSEIITRQSLWDGHIEAVPARAQELTNLYNTYNLDSSKQAIDNIESRCDKLEGQLFDVDSIAKLNLGESAQYD